MTLNIASWNVRGLEMGNRKYIVRDWCRKLKGKDIICLQEIKVIGFQAPNTMKFIWNQAMCFVTDHERGK